MTPDISQEKIDAAYDTLNKAAAANGYYLNTDADFTKELVHGLLVNKERYGYQACPCRLASGVRKEDLDLICPCDYRDADLSEFDACYCGLYVSKKIISGEKKLRSIRDRRPADGKIISKKEDKQNVQQNLPYPVWRCKVCGYLCARETPPETCPICKVDKERFERFM